MGFQLIRDAIIKFSCSLYTTSYRNHEAIIALKLTPAGSLVAMTASYLFVSVLASAFQSLMVLSPDLEATRAAPPQADADPQASVATACLRSSFASSGAREQFRELDLNMPLIEQLPIATRAREQFRGRGSYFESSGAREQFWELGRELGLAFRGPLPPAPPPWGGRRTAN